ncbi:MAG: hypothetical protein ACRCUI_04830 [Polymorphobacter sp.]
MSQREDAYNAILVAATDASKNLFADRAAAKGDLELIRKVNRNNTILQNELRNAAIELLGELNPEVVAATEAILHVNHEIKRRRKAAESLVSIISGVSDAVTCARVIVDKLND